MFFFPTKTMAEIVGLYRGFTNDEETEWLRWSQKGYKNHILTLKKKKRIGQHGCTAVLFTQANGKVASHTVTRSM